MSKLSETKLTPSANLAKVIGSEAISRPQAMKKVWDYIKSHSLQDATNKRMINADGLLKPIFNKDQVSMFEIAKLVGKELN